MCIQFHTYNLVEHTLLLHEVFRARIGPETPLIANKPLLHSVGVHPQRPHVPQPHAPRDAPRDAQLAAPREAEAREVPPWMQPPVRRNRDLASFRVKADFVGLKVPQKVRPPNPPPCL